MRLWLKEFRETANKTQVVVADEAEISRSYYTNIENGTKTPSVNTAKSIARVLCFQWELFLMTNVPLKNKMLRLTLIKKLFDCTNIQTHKRKESSTCSKLKSIRVNWNK